MTTTGVITFRKARTMIDLNGSYQLGNRLSLFFQVRNLFNIPEYRYQVDPMYGILHMAVARSTPAASRARSNHVPAPPPALGSRRCMSSARVRTSILDP